MVEAAPSSIELLDFQFKLHSKLKIFESDDETRFQNATNATNLVAAASRFGLVFVGTNEASLEVIQLKSIEDSSATKYGSNDFTKRNVPLNSTPTHLSLNCDHTLLAVIVTKGDCALTIIYNVQSFLSKNVVVVREIRISATPGVAVLETNWNPTIPTVFTACKSDGSLGVYNIQENSIDINEIPSMARATCFCWSPKGKQIVVGSMDGTLTQYKPDLKAVKAIPGPMLQGTGPFSVLNVCWLTNYQFIAVYKDTGDEEMKSSILIVNAPKTGAVTYINYDDICYSYGNLRAPQFYVIHQPAWSVLLIASANSMEVGVLGVTQTGEPALWQQWNQTDAARAELPLTQDQQETFPIGFALDTGVVLQLPWGENQVLPPMPFLHILSHHGILCSFSVINISPNAGTICFTPESVSDQSGLNLFVNENKNLPNVMPTTVQNVIVTTPFSSPSINTVQPAPQFGSALNSSFPTLNLTPKSTPPPPPPAAVSTTPLISCVSTSVVSSPIASTPAFSAPPISKPKPLLETPKDVVPLNVTIKAAKKEESALNDYTIQKLVKEELKNFETELKDLFKRCRTLNINVGSENEKSNLVITTDQLTSFYKELQEATDGQIAEVHYLKQALIQSFAWYEDTKTRHKRYSDPNYDFLHSHDLDPVSEKQLADIKHLVYYIEAQLNQIQMFLDNQWAEFQDSCKKQIKKDKIHMPVLQPIYQLLVRQNAIIDRQRYILKDINVRIKNRSQKESSLCPQVLNVGKKIEISEELRKLKLEPDEPFANRFNKIVINEQKFTETKQTKLCSFFTNRSVVHISPRKPNFVTSSLLLNASLKMNSIIDSLSSAQKSLDYSIHDDSTTEVNLSASNLFSFTLLDGVQPTKLITPEKPKPAAMAIGTPISKTPEIALMKNTFNIGTVPTTKSVATTTAPVFNFMAPVSIQTKPQLFTSEPNLNTNFMFTKTDTKPVEINKQPVVSTLIKPNAIKTIPETTTLTSPTTTSSGVAPVKPFTFTVPSLTKIDAATTPKVAATSTTLSNRDSIDNLSAFSFGSNLNFNQQSTPKPKSPVLNFITPTPKSPTIVSSATQIVAPKPTFATAFALPPVTTSNQIVITSPTTIASVTITPVASKGEVVSTSPVTPSIFGGISFGAPTKTTGSLFGQSSFFAATTTAAITTTAVASPTITSVAATATSANIPASTVGNIFESVSPTATPQPSTVTTEISSAATSAPITFSFIKPIAAATATTTIAATTTVPESAKTETFFGGTTQIGANALLNTTPTTTFNFLQSPPITTSVIVTPKISQVFSLATGAATVETPTVTSTVDLKPKVSITSSFDLKQSEPVVGTPPSTFGFESFATTSSDAKFSFGNLNLFSTTSPTTTTVTTTSSGPFSFALQTTSPTTNTSSFGNNTSNIFGKPVAAATTTTTSSTFLSQPICSPSAFSPNVSGGSLFGQSGGNIFAQKPSTPSTQNTSLFGQSSGSIFGGNTTASTPSVFGQTSNSPFSSPVVSNTTSSIFGQAPAFSPATLSNTTPTSGGSIFGKSTFGAPAPTSSPSSSNTFSFTQNTNTNTGFGGGGGGGGSSGSIFGAKPTFGQAPAFGQPAAFNSAPAFGSGSIFGGGGGASSTFGGSSFGTPSNFGQKPAFGSSATFGQSAFGVPPAFGGSPTFGSPERVFGSSPTSQAGGAFGSSMQENSTFANLANQNTLGFGNLSQNQPSPPQSQPSQFSGGTQFSSWR